MRILFILIILIAVLLGGFFLLSKSQTVQSPISQVLPKVSESNAAVKAGKKLSSNLCQGGGVPYNSEAVESSAYKLSVSPMRAEDFTHIEPYGIMIGDHVTPIDHQYFSPTIFKSPKDTYPVFAMADAKIVGIEVHPTRIRLVFSVTCTFFYYYDLLTSVESNINDKNLPISVKAGQLIGHIGGQTLDFAVWDTTKPLAGFIVPEHYEAEAWKLYTADPLDYYTDDLKALILSKYVRTQLPVSGKIDYDIDGKLIGNWFEIGNLGYAGEATDPRLQYWKGHLSFAPHFYDPSAFIISVGYLVSESGESFNQFSVPRSSPSPATIGMESGLIKYELRRWNDLKKDGTRWDHLELTKDIRLDNDNEPSSGCALVQMIDKRKLKFETFLKTSCENINGFSSAAKSYER